MMKTIATKDGGVQVKMTPEEEASLIAEQAAYVEPAPPPPPETEIRLAALEAKVGITPEDKEAARSDLMAAK